MLISRWLKPRLPQRWGPVHRGWTRYLDVLHSAGVAAELWADSLPGRIGDDANAPFRPATASHLLHAYYRGDGDLEAGLRRLRADRYFGLNGTSASANARDVVAGLRLAAPELGSVGLIDDADARKTLYLRTVGARAAVEPQAADATLRQVPDPIYGGSRILVRSLVHAFNELLATRALPYRFLPLDTAHDVESYLAVEPEDALILDGIDAFEAPLTELRDFAVWERATRMTVAPAKRRVA